MGRSWVFGKDSAEPDLGEFISALIKETEILNCVPSCQARLWEVTMERTADLSSRCKCIALNMLTEGESSRYQGTFLVAITGTPNPQK